MRNRSLTDFSTTGTLQSFQSVDDVNHERLGNQMSWDVAEEKRQQKDIDDAADTVSLAQAFQDPEFLRDVMEMVSGDDVAQDDKGEAVLGEEEEEEEEEEQSEKRDSGYGSQGQIKEVKPVSGLTVYPILFGTPGKDDGTWNTQIQAAQSLCLSMTIS